MKNCLPINSFKDFDFPNPNYFVGINNEIDDSIWDEEDIKDQLEELNDLTREDVENILNALVAERGLRHSISRERNEEHLRFFVNQLFHIVLVAQKNKLPYDPLKHMCIGSDFDGFIRAIDTCRKISQLSNFGPQLGITLKH